MGRGASRQAAFLKVPAVGVGLCSVGLKCAFGGRPRIAEMAPFPTNLLLRQIRSCLLSKSASKEGPGTAGEAGPGFALLTEKVGRDHDGDHDGTRPPPRLAVRITEKECFVKMGLVPQSGMAFVTVIGTTVQSLSRCPLLFSPSSPPPSLVGLFGSPLGSEHVPTKS